MSPACRSGRPGPAGNRAEMKIFGRLIASNIRCIFIFSIHCLLMCFPGLGDLLLKGDGTLNGLRTFSSYIVAQEVFQHISFCSCTTFEKFQEFHILRFLEERNDNHRKHLNLPFFLWPSKTL